MESPRLRWLIGDGSRRWKIGQISQRMFGRRERDGLSAWEIYPQTRQREGFVLRRESIVPRGEDVDVDGPTVHPGSRHGRNIPLTAMRRVATNQSDMKARTFGHHPVMRPLAR